MQMKSRVLFSPEPGTYGRVYRRTYYENLSAREAIAESARGWVRGEWVKPRLDADDGIVASVLAVGVASPGTRFFSHYIDTLTASNLSRLIRVVRDWNIEATHFVGYTGGLRTADEYFHGLVLDGSHRLLRRRPTKQPWHWFRRWRGLFLGVLNDEFSSGDMLELLMKAESRLRRRRRPASPPRRRSRSERLQCLADTIVGHAPPLFSDSRVRPTEAG
jgi:hypothetical protein